ncbi:hypothetical protein KYK30_30030 [Shinella yambaruensis]|uniref:Helix-turn-helix domain-containing protein n=1 Tax=Shinella yambaruensis TaxID=415996 RepID=A0ABQ5ZDK3_9HYPH|nr:hypothetical protein [Shinella yambaruensis]MCJ8028711.1 hypothetical protein [Shinella yambaruensis]MCU7983960.1 hypothetical protein [Shinella yambaruensis]GLR49922.1 hypothetical protein GCM10007923_11270 [Shinella yambaruensis]
MALSTLGRWSAEEICAAADIAREKGVGVRLQADGSVSIGIVPPPFQASQADAAGGGSATETTRVFSPATLAKRWHCSGHHIRNMVAAGRLAGFNLGGKLLRISREEVERIENSASNALEAPIDPELIEPPADTLSLKKERAKTLGNPLAHARVNALRDGRV